MQITNAVVPAAGRGTRLLPSAKTQLKGTIPACSKPFVQHVVEALDAAGIVSIFFIAYRCKRTIEDHFDKAPELRATLERTGRRQLFDALHIEDTQANGRCYDGSNYANHCRTFIDYALANPELGAGLRQYLRGRLYDESSG